MVKQSILRFWQFDGERRVFINNKKKREEEKKPNETDGAKTQANGFQMRKKFHTQFVWCQLRLTALCL